MIGAQLRKVLDRLHQKHEIIGEVRSHGLMLAIELVTDRNSKTPAVAATADIFEKTREHCPGLSKSGAHVGFILERAFSGY